MVTPEQFDQRQHELTVVAKVLSAFISRKVNTDRDGNIHEVFFYVLPSGKTEMTNSADYAMERLLAETRRCWL